jgi:tellurite resistance protein
MPRDLHRIIADADELAARFETTGPGKARDAGALREVRQAFLSVAAAQQHLDAAVAVARADGHSWATIGAMVGTSGEAARQRYS